MKAVGVIGAGVIGRGVAQNLACSGYKVVLIDLSDKILVDAKQEIQQNMRFQSLLKKSQPAVNVDDVINRITFSTESELLANSDFVIENATEKWEIKKDIYRKVDNICQEDCIFAANTSCIPITKIASLTKRAKKVIGIHFMNPVPLKPMVEVVRGYHTTDETIEATKELLKGMDKCCIVVNDFPGFVLNRILMLTINEAAFVIQDQVSSVEEVDRLFKTCIGHKMGPLETADLIGIDTILNSIEGLYESFNDSKYRPCPLLKKMVDAGLHGMKSGQGFYKYEI